ncbi:cytochrome c family protein [bacterium]|nr:cytochrome c family protein [bacterium]
MNALSVLRYPAMILSAVAIFIAVFVAIPQFREKPAGKPSDITQSPAPVTMPVMVDNSCSARNCHGDIIPHSDGDLSQLESTVWSTRDHHAEAWKSLSSDLAKSISLRLSPPGTTPIPADQDVRCLACHSTPTIGTADTSGGHWDTHGVSCEACHGRADRWRDQHYAWREMLKKEKSPDIDHRLREAYAAHDMVWLGDDLSRAKTCAACHVGAPPSTSPQGLPVRDVNHDLIAAGHPRLQFDLNAYLKAMPPHWNEHDSSANLHLRRWAAGQWSAMRAWLELLRYRSETGEKNGWPELAEYRCFSCHHDLKENAWRQQGLTKSASSPGSLKWGNYYSNTFADAAAVLFPGISTAPLLERWKELDSSLVNPMTSPDEIGKNADALLHAMKEVQQGGDGQKVEFNLAAFRQSLSERISQLMNDPSAVDWDVAAQLLIEFRALRDDGDLSPDQNEKLKQLSMLLSFPEGRLSPSDFDPRSSEFRSTVVPFLSVPK